MWSSLKPFQNIKVPVFKVAHLNSFTWIDILILVTFMSSWNPFSSGTVIQIAYKMVPLDISYFEGTNKLLRGKMGGYQLRLYQNE